MAERKFYRGANPAIFSNARALRKGATSAEKQLWEELQKGKLMGLRFRRQHPAGQFILDFYCHKLNLGIEVDGNYHNEPDQQEHDLGREYELSELGITILRFTNAQVENQLSEVVNCIREFAELRLGEQ